MDSRVALLAFLVVIFSTSSTADDAAPLPDCATQLLVCQPYLKNPNNPPASCCTPLKDLIINDLKCLCDLFKNQDILKLINVSIEEALRLPKACGSKADVSICEKGGNVPVPIPAGAPTSQPSIPSTNGTSSTPAGSITKSSASRNSDGKIGSRSCSQLDDFPDDLVSLTVTRK